MVKQLDPPQRPLPRAARFRWTWAPRPDGARWRWCRVHHRGNHTPDGKTFRRFGPLYRLDHHHAATAPDLDRQLPGHEWPGLQLLFVTGCHASRRAGDR